MIDINWHPSRKELRTFAVLQIVFFGIVAWGLRGKGGSDTLSISVFSLSVAVGIAGFAFPRFMRIVYVGWMAAVMPIGWAVSHLVLAFAFFLVLTPIGVVMRLLGRDPLNRKFDGAAATYWIRRTPPENSKRYFRQF